MAKYSIHYNRYNIYYEQIQSHALSLNHTYTLINCMPTTESESMSGHNDRFSQNSGKFQVVRT